MWVSAFGKQDTQIFFKHSSDHISLGAWSLGPGLFSCLSLTPVPGLRLGDGIKEGSAVDRGGGT